MIVSPLTLSHLLGLLIAALVLESTWAHNATNANLSNKNVSKKIPAVPVVAAAISTTHQDTMTTNSYRDNATGKKSEVNLGILEPLSLVPNDMLIPKDQSELPQNVMEPTSLMTTTITLDNITEPETSTTSTTRNQSVTEKSVTEPDSTISTTRNQSETEKSVTEPDSTISTTRNQSGTEKSVKETHSTISTTSNQSVTKKSVTKPESTTTTIETTNSSLSYLLPIGTSEQNGTILYSWIFSCHGVTTPVQPLSNYQSYSLDLQFIPQWLTDAGQQQMYDLGKWIRNWYPTLDKSFDPNKVEILSQILDCVFMSAECLSTSLFPSNGSKVHLPRKKETLAKVIRAWQPTPIHVIDPMMGLLGSTSDLTCHQYDIELDNVKDYPSWSTLLQTYNATIDYINRNSDYTFVDSSVTQILHTVYQVYYDLRTQELAGLPLPKWTNSVYPEPINSLAIKYLELFTSTETLRRFKAGPVIEMIVNSMKQKTKGKLEENLKLVLCDQFALTSIMNSFGVYNQLVPPFGSAFLIELSKRQDQFFITMYLKNSSAHSTYKLSIPGCGSTCTFDQFSNLTQSQIPTNWSEECQTINLAALTLSTPLLIAGLVVVIVLIFLTLLLIVKCCRCFNQKKTSINTY